MLVKCYKAFSAPDSATTRRGELPLTLNYLAFCLELSKLSTPYSSAPLLHRLTCVWMFFTLRWPDKGVDAMCFLPSAPNVKVQRFNQARVNGGSNYDYDLNIFIFKISE